MRSNAVVPCGSGSNQTSVPLGVRIIGPDCASPEAGETNTSPSAGSDAGVVTVTAGGSRSWREWNRVTFEGVPETGMAGAGAGSV